MALPVFGQQNAAQIRMAYGTGYHEGTEEDHADQVFKGVKAEKIGSHDFVDVEGLIFSYRHFIGRSSIPHGRFTAIGREKLWAEKWAKRREYPDPDIIIRSHVHYFGFCGDADWLGVTTPALQGYGSKYGARIASGTVDFGFISFDVHSKELHSVGQAADGCLSADRDEHRRA